MSAIPPQSLQRGILTQPKEVAGGCLAPSPHPPHATFVFLPWLSIPMTATAHPIEFLPRQPRARYWRASGASRLSARSHKPQVFIKPYKRHNSSLLGDTIVSIAPNV